MRIKIPPRIRRALVLAPLSLAYLSAGILGLDYLCYRRYYSALERTHKPSALFDQASRDARLSPDILHSLGAVGDPKRPGRYTSYPPRKGSGVIRIGTFGGSWTYGWEVGPGLDFPALLGEIFRKKGYRNVEVVNFGNIWHGFHQSYRFWEQFGRRYDLDFVVFGPKLFHDDDRDAAFNHALPSEPYFIHGRYILKDGGVSFIDPIGKRDFADRFRRYFSFLPYWTYLRYDINAPAFIACLHPADRPPIENPFYYLKGDPYQEEKSLIAGVLLARLAEANKQVVLLTLRDVDGLSVNPPGRTAVQDIPNLDVFPLRRMKHLSGIGNLISAQIVFDLLTKRDESHFELLDFHTLPIGKTRRRPVALDDFPFAEFEIGGVPLGTFADLPAGQGDESSVANFQQRKTQSLLALQPDQTSLLDAFYLPLDFKLEPGSRVELRLKTARGRSMIDLGAVNFLLDGAPIAYIPLGGMLKRGREILIPSSWADRNGLDIETFQAGSVWAGGKKIHDLRMTKNGLALLPKKVDRLSIKPLQNALLDVARLPPKGVMTLTLKGGRGASAPLPFVGWVKRSQSISCARRGLSYYVAKSPDGRSGIIRPIAENARDGERNLKNRVDERREDGSGTQEGKNED